MDDNYRKALAQALTAPPPSSADVYARNAPYVRPGADNFNTPLAPLDEMAFRSWVAGNNVPFNPDAGAPQDYNMRGFWRGLQQQNPRAVTGVNPNDQQLHFPDYWKTPYHETFSNESQYAGAMAPRWTEDDKLIGPNGRILFDERNK